jgi:hypothetical protein
LNKPGQAIYAMSDALLEPGRAYLRTYVEQVLSGLGIEPHGMLSSGHGLLAWFRLADNGPDDLDTIRACCRAIVQRINAKHDPQGKQRLADPQVVDAGTRLARLPLSRNVKNPEHPREVAVLWQRPGTMTVGELATLAGIDIAAQQPRRPQTVATPGSLADRDLEEMIGIFRPYWVEGQRHTCALDIAGVLANEGISREQAAAVVESLAGGIEASARLRDVDDTFDKIARGESVRGWSGVAEWMPATDKISLENVLGRIEREPDPVPRLRASVIVPVEPVDDPDVMVSSFSVTPFPEAAWYGWFRDWRDIVAPTTEAPSQYHLGAALALVGAMVGRQIRLDFGDGLYTNQFVLLLGLSGSSKKDTAIKRAVNLPGIYEQARPDRLTITAPTFGVLRNVTSGEGLIAKLKEHNNQLVYISEINKLLSMAQRKGAGGVLDTLLEAWDIPPTLETNSIRAQSEQAAKALNPYVSVIAAGQPGRFADMIRDEDIFSGFANRWLYVPGIGGTAGKMAREGAIGFDDAVRLYDGLRAAISTCATYGAGGIYTMPMTSAAEDLNADWYDRINRSKGDDEAHASMRERHQVIGLKAATAYAITDGERYMDVHHLEAAIALVEWSWENVRRLMRLWGVSVAHKLEDRILTVLRQRGNLTKRELQQQCSSRLWTRVEFAKVVDSLHRAEVIEFKDGGYQIAPLRRV